LLNPLYREIKNQPRAIKLLLTAKANTIWFGIEAYLPGAPEI
jgi:hypothetical protein